MIVFNKKLFKNLYIFSNGSLLTNVKYKTQNSNLKLIFLEKDLKSVELFSKNKSSKKDIDLNTSLNYRKLLFK